MDTKQLDRIEIKSADQGQVTAVFSTFDVLDSDGDITLPGAFEEGAEVPISAYGHTSWQGALPVGKGIIRTTNREAILDGQFFMNTAAGRDTFEIVKQLGPLGQWSYGYDAVDFGFGERDGRKVRFLRRVATHEVSPVLIGAGVNVRTLGAKAGASGQTGGTPVGFEYKAAIRPHDTEISVDPWDSTAAVKGVGASASVSDLRSMFAWVNPEGDPELKSSYRFPHHTDVNGPANIRACLFGIAALNGAGGGASVPEADRKGVYNHLAAHLRDADREPPELRSGSADGIKHLQDELLESIVVVSGALDSASRVVALRAAKGKKLSQVNAEYLAWLDEDLRRLKSLLTSAEEEARYEYLRFLRSQLGE